MVLCVPSFDSIILFVNAALSFLQYQHTAVSFFNFSQIGISSRTLLNAFLSNVPSSAATITIFPELANFSQNSGIYFY
jgi:hypothetical protein